LRRWALVHSVLGPAHLLLPPSLSYACQHTPGRAGERRPGADSATATDTTGAGRGDKGAPVYSPGPPRPLLSLSAVLPPRFLSSPSAVADATSSSPWPPAALCPLDVSRSSAAFHLNFRYLWIALGSSTTSGSSRPCCCCRRRFTPTPASPCCY
jgi:hypothetical protein